MKAKAVFDAIDAIFLFIFKWISVTLFVVLTIIITANVFVRYVPIMSLHWLDEIVELSFAWMVFFGSAAIWILKGHFSAGDWIGKLLKNPRARAAYRLVVDLISFVFIAVFFWYSLQLYSRSIEVTAVFEFPRKIIYACMPISSAVMGLYSLKFIVQGIVDIVKGASSPP
ncbi:MAG TPA: TRAP transporter small permease subunit [Rectinemataceae bacterium]|nr:TRAP transporter small permease subunit [Rectinemataceae bacterium]